MRRTYSYSRERGSRTRAALRAAGITRGSSSSGTVGASGTCRCAVGEGTGELLAMSTQGSGVMGELGRSACWSSASSSGLAACASRLVRRTLGDALGDSGDGGAGGHGTVRTCSGVALTSVCVVRSAGGRRIAGRLRLCTGAGGCVALDVRTNRRDMCTSAGGRAKPLRRRSGRARSPLRISCKSAARGASARGCALGADTVRFMRRGVLGTAAGPGPKHLARSCAHRRGSDALNAGSSTSAQNHCASSRSSDTARVRAADPYAGCPADKCAVNCKRHS